MDPGNTLATAQMQEYVPKEAVLTYGENKSRIMFYHQTYFESEEAVLKEFREYCKSLGKPIPGSPAEVLRCLYQAKMNVKKAYESCVAKVNFQIEKLPILIDPVVFDLFNQGFLYICGRDRHYRPILVTNPWLLLKQPEMPSDEQVIACAMIVMEYLSKYMLIPGKVENCLTIFDLNNSVMSLPISKIKSLMTTMQLNYKCRTRNIIMLNAPKTFATLWWAVQYFIQENTKQKIKMTEESTHPIFSTVSSLN